MYIFFFFFFFFQAEDGIRDLYVTGVQTCALPILSYRPHRRERASVRVLPSVRAAVRRVGMDDAGIRAELPTDGPHRVRTTMHRSAVGQEPRYAAAVRTRARQAVRRAPERPPPRAGEPVRPVEGPDRRHRG